MQNQSNDKAKIKWWQPFVRFYHNESGVYYIIMALISLGLMATVAFVIQTSNMFTQKARLADGLEQAVLAVTTENNQFRSPGALSGNELIATNKNLVNSYVKSYVPNAQDLDFDTKCYNVEPACHCKGERTVVCSVVGRYKENSLFPFIVKNDENLGNGGKNKGQDKGVVVIPRQVSVGSAAYAQADTKQHNVYYPQDVVFAFSTSGSMDQTWRTFPGVSRFCLTGSKFYDRSVYIDRYRESCLQKINAELDRVPDGFSGILPYSKMDMIRKVLFAQTLADWKGEDQWVNNYVSDPLTEQQAVGIIPSLAIANISHQDGGDRYRFMVSDFAYPDPNDYDHKCVFPFVMSPPNRGYYDWFDSDPFDAYDHAGHHAYHVDEFKSVSDFYNVLNASLQHFTYYPVVMFWTLSKSASFEWYRGMVFTSLLHQYLDVKKTAEVVNSFNGQMHNFRTTFDNTSDLTVEKDNIYWGHRLYASLQTESGELHHENSLACFNGIEGSRTNADSGWQWSRSGEGVNQVGLQKLEEVFDDARPSSMTFLPTALMQAAQGAVVGDGSDRLRCKVIVLIAGTTQDLFDWTGTKAERWHDSEKNAYLSVDTSIAIGPPVEAWQSEPGIHDWWARQAPITHIQKNYGYCDSGDRYLPSRAYQKLHKTTNKADCEAGVSDLGNMYYGKWVTYDEPVAVPNPVVPVLTKKEYDKLKYKDNFYDNNFDLYDRVPFVQAVFQRIQYELLDPGHADICNKIRSHLAKVSGLDNPGDPEPIIALVIIDKNHTPSELFWKQCVSIGHNDPYDPNHVGPLLFHVSSPAQFNVVVRSILQPPAVGATHQTGTLNISHDYFEQLKYNSGQ